MDSIIYNGVDLSGANYGIVLEGHPVPAIMSPDVDVQEVAHGGGISQGKTYRPIVFGATVAVRGASPSDLRQKIEAMHTLFDVESDKTLVFDIAGWRHKRWNARLYRPSLDQVINDRTVRLTLAFICANPIAESTELLTENYTPTSNAFTFYVPDDVAATVGGNCFATPVYTIKATAGGTESTVKVKNVTRDEEIVYNVALADGHWLRINTALMSVQKSTDSGTTWTNVIGSCDTGPFPVLTAGVRNEMLLTGADNSTLEVEYRRRYLGG